MTSLKDSFLNCYLVQYSIEPDKTINALKALPLKLVESTKTGTPFYGAVGGGPYGIRFVNDATHVGLFDLTDPDNPIALITVEYSTMETRKMYLHKSRGHYVIFRRGDKNFKFYISEYKTLRDARKNAKPKLDPQTQKINQTLKSLKHKKAT